MQNLSSNFIRILLTGSLNKNGIPYWNLQYFPESLNLCDGLKEGNAAVSNIVKLFLIIKQVLIFHIFREGSYMQLICKELKIIIHFQYINLIK
jgi:hypothetical protein